MEQTLENRQSTFGSTLRNVYWNRLDPQGENKLNAAITAGRAEYDAFIALLESEDADTVATFKGKYKSDTESVFEDIIERRVQADISFRKN